MTNEVSAHAVVLGATEVMEPPIPDDSVGARVASLLELLPTQAVEDQEDDLRGPFHRLGHPGGSGSPP